MHIQQRLTITAYRVIIVAYKSHMDMCMHRLKYDYILRSVLQVVRDIMHYGIVQL